MPRSRVLEDALQGDLLPPPRKVQTPQSVDLKKHYRYLCNYGHTIDECATLKDKIEKLLQADYLKRFMRRDDIDSSHSKLRRYDDRR